LAQCLDQEIGSGIVAVLDGRGTQFGDGHAVCDVFLGDRGIRDQIASLIPETLLQ
jgi:hypothetical protein